jgi:hypothetical protein
MDTTRVVRLSCVRTGSWVTGKVTVHLPEEPRARASRPITARVEDASAEIAEVLEWALCAALTQEGFWN